jgi:LysM repeat protein
VARQAKTCLMCNMPLDGAPVQGMLHGVSWFWVGAVAVAAALFGIGYNRWQSQPRPAISTPAPTAPAAPPVARAGGPAVTVSPTPIPISPLPSATPVIYVVKKGDTVLAIAVRYGTDMQAIMQANGLDDKSARLLRVGQELVIPDTGGVSGQPPEGSLEPPQIIYTVKSGDTISSIALEYETSIEAILAANHLGADDLIHPGQNLVVPLAPPTPSPTPTFTPTPTSTPGPPYAAPDLLFPTEGQQFEGKDAGILLTWTSVSILRGNQVYLVELRAPGRATPVTHTTQTTSWRLPAELWPTADPHLLTWQVSVAGGSGAPSEGASAWQPLSPPSVTRQFVWQ